MARAKQLPDLALGKRWPHRLLHLFPQGWKRDYLLRQSGGEDAKGAFDLTERLKDAKKFLVVWPEGGEKLLIAFPAVRALRDVTGPGSVYAHLVPAGWSGLVADLFPGEQILSWSREELAWHEPSVQAAKLSLQAFAPQVSVNLMHPSPMIVSALVKASGANLRMAFSHTIEKSEAGAHTEMDPFANVRIQARAESPLAGQYFQFLNPWRYAGFSVEERWPHFESDSDSFQVSEIWKGSNAIPEQTWLYVYDSSDASRVLDDDFYSWLWERVQARESEDVSIALVVLNPSHASVVREGRWRNVSVLKASGLSEFVSLLSMSRGVAAFHGLGLHIASLADVRCLAFLQKGEAAYDVSNWNPLFEVEWVGGG